MRRVEHALREAFDLAGILGSASLKFFMSHPIANFDSHAISASGWNTWNTKSVLAHVLMPEALEINLSFRHYGMLKTIRDASFGVVEQPPTAGVRLAAEKASPRKSGVSPGRHAYDGSYTCVTVILGELTATVETARADKRDLVILIKTTSSQSLYKPAALVLEAAYLWNRPGHVRHAAPQIMRADSPAGPVAIHATTLPGADPNAGCRSPYWVFPLTGDAVGFSTGGERSLYEIENIINKARAAEEVPHARYGEDAELHAAYQTCLAWNTVFEPSFNRVITTASRPWNVLRFGYGIFCWDSFFFIWLLANDAPALARNCALEVFREMIDGKFVANVVNGSGRRSWDRSQPPVGGLCVLALHEAAPDDAFLDTIWPALLAWNRWWHETRRNHKGLLSWGSSPGEARVGDLAEFLQPGTRFGASLESGMDNSPMYDGVELDSETHQLMLSDAGLVSLYITDCQALSILARARGCDADAAELENRAALYTEKLSTLWNADAGIYQNKHTDTDAFNPRLAPPLFYPMLAGAASGEQAESMVNKYLLNPEKFWGEWVIPSVPHDDPAYPEQLYWRGRIWAAHNFLVYLGLKRSGQNDAAAKLAARSRALFERNWNERHGVFENYSAVTGKAEEEKFCDPMCAWSGLLVFIDFIEKGRIPLLSLFSGRAEASP